MRPDNFSSESPAFELKGSILTVMVLHIKETDPDRLYPQLLKKIGQGRSFFTNAPVLIDLHGVEEANQSTFDCHLLAETLRGLSLVPVAVRGAVALLEEQILQAGMGLLPTVKGERSIALPEIIPQARPEPPPENTPKPLPEAQPLESSPAETHNSAAAMAEANAESSAEPQTKVITQPIRSGQQVLAPGGDLVILSSVNAGAEVLAAGNIHVYGALRGRALAGINGDTSACIFSMQCNPELVAVAGEYVVNELLDKSIMNRSVMISLQNGGLQFTPIGTPSHDKH